MVGTYKIIEILAQSPKFSCMVSFNEGEPELYEVEVPNDIGDGQGKNLPELNAEFVASVLQQVADDQLAAVAPIVEEIQVAEGKIIS